MTSIKVSKFGGSSMKDAVAMKRSASIIKSHQKNQLTIVSATYGTTNELEEIMELSQSNSFDLISEKLDALKQRHINISKDLDLSSEEQEKITNLCSELTTLAKGIFFLKELTPKAKDRIYSVGERLSSTLFVGCLQSTLGEDFNVEFLDARDFLITDAQFNKAKPLTNEIKDRCQILKEKLENNQNLYFV